MISEWKNEDVERFKVICYFGLYLIINYYFFFINKNCWSIMLLGLIVYFLNKLD